MNQWINEGKRQWIKELMNRWISEFLNGWINEPMNQSMNEWLNEAMTQWTHESKSQWIKEPRNQWIKESMNKCTFPTSSSKSALILWFFFAILSANRALALYTVSCDNFHRLRPGPGETQTLLRRPQEPHYPKKHKPCPGMLSRVNSQGSELLHFPTAWCGWHDGVNANHGHPP